MSCKVCGTSVEPFMSFGDMPIANGFLEKPMAKEELYTFDMAPLFCPKCYTFQLLHQPAAELMFHENYAFQTRTSSFMVDHFRRTAEWVTSKYFQNEGNRKALEIGCNDGVFLEHLNKLGWETLGCEPSLNVAAKANEFGVNTLEKFFDVACAEDIKSQMGLLDLVYASNVMCHIPNINDVAEGISKLLKLNGFLIFEDPYLGSVLDRVGYDQIYDEHVFIFSAISVQNIFAKFGLHLIDTLSLDTHGGSVRYILQKTGQSNKKISTPNLINLEKEKRLDQIETYHEFKLACEKSKLNFVEKLEKVRNNNLPIIGYAATSKSTTVLNYTGVDCTIIDKIVDTSPEKWAKYTPGTNIPIERYTPSCLEQYSHVVLFAWNHFKEIEQKEVNFMERNGQWISHVELR